jgi:outer membrane lipoprotein-sorting protein
LRFDIQTGNIYEVLVRKEVLGYRSEKTMKKQVSMVGMIGIIISMILVIVGLSGCTQQNTSADETKIDTTTPTLESVQTILGKADTIESMYYEIAASITMPQYGTQTATIKIWQKTPYLKEQITSVTSGITNSITVIQRPEGIYTYNTAQGKYVLTTDETSIASSLQYLDSKTIKNYLNNQTSTTFQTEVIDGKKATIIEYTPLQGSTLMAIKMWIWNEKGVPLKALINMTMEQTTMTMDFRFNNYSFSDIPDNTFSVL